MAPARISKHASTLALLTFALGSTAACTSELVVSREDFAHYVTVARCEAYFACECSMYGDSVWRDIETCMELGEEWLTEFADTVEDAGLKYDASCPANYADELEALACSNDWTRAQQDCSVCLSFHGDVPEGEPCDHVPAGAVKYSTCAQGLVCANDGDGGRVCTDPCDDRVQYLEQGEPCDGPEADQCLIDLACIDGTCQAAPGVFEPCPELRCADAYCDQDAGGGPSCVPLLPNDAECEADRECETRSCDGWVGTCSEPMPLACANTNF